MNRPAAPLDMTTAQRQTLETIARSHTAPHRLVVRARALLAAAEGVANTRIAAELDVSLPTLRNWRKAFAQQGLRDFGKIADGRGRRPAISPEKIDEIVRLTQEGRPEGETHWSNRSMAKATGVSPATVQRIWSARGLKPHLVRTFKLSNDPRFEEKLIDVVGLYLNPPDCTFR